MFRFSLILFIAGLPGLFGFLFYPDATSLTVVSGVSAPVVEYFPERRILIDWCFTMGFDLPNKVSSFYNIPIWPGHTPGHKVVTRSMILQNDTHHRLYEKYEQHGKDKRRHPKDVTAGELYQNLEDILVSYGFHETCLLRSVCELARHPFDEDHQNILTYILTFLLTPSQHESFDPSEELYRQAYEDAEMQGFLQHNCEELYSECKIDLLSSITKVIFHIG